MYPQAVEQALDLIVDSLEETGFFEQEHCKVQYVREEFGKVLVQQWLGDGEFGITMEQAEHLLNRALICESIENLTKRGLIDTIENENGEEVVYLTEKGKSVKFEPSACEANLDILNRF